MLQSDARSDEQRVLGGPSPQPPPASQEMPALSLQAPEDHEEIAFEDAYFEISDITREWASLADAIGVWCASDDDSDAVSEMLQLEHPDSSSPSVASSQGELLALQGPAAMRPGDGAQSSPTRHEDNVSQQDAGGNLPSAMAPTHVFPDGICVAADIQADDIRTDHSDAGVTSSSARRNNTPPHVMESNAPTRSTPPNTSFGPQQPVMHHNIPPSAPSPMFPGTDVSNRALPPVGPPSAHESPSAHFHPSLPLLSLHSAPSPPSLPPHPVPSTAPVSLSPQSGRTALPRASSASSASTFAHGPVERHLGDRHAHRTPTPSQDTLEVSVTVRPVIPGPARADLATEVTVKAEPVPALTIAQLARRAPTPASHATAPPDSVGTIAEAKLQRQLLAARARTTQRQKAVPATTRRTGTSSSPESPPSTSTSVTAMPSHAGQDARAAMNPPASSSPMPFYPPTPPANTTSGRAHAGANQQPSPSSPSELDAPTSSELRPLSSDSISEGTRPSTASAEDPRHSQVESNPFGNAARPNCAPFAMSQLHDPHSTRASFAHRLASAGLPQKPTWPFETHASGVARPVVRTVLPSEYSFPHVGATIPASEAAPPHMTLLDAASGQAPLSMVAGPPGLFKILLPVDASIERRVVSGSSRDRRALSPASQLSHELPSTVATPPAAPEAPRAASGPPADRLRPSSVARPRLDHSPPNGKSHGDRAGNSSSASPSMRSSYEPPPVAASSGVAVHAERRSLSPASSDCARSAQSHKPALIYRIRDPTPSVDEGSGSPSPPGAQIPLLPRISAATPVPLIQRVGPQPEAKKKKNKKRKRKQSNEDQDVDGSESQAHGPKKQRR